MKPNIESSFEITKNSFNSNEVRFSWGMHVLTSMMNSIRDARAGKSEIL
jgi:hypothetical protein